MWGNFIWLTSHQASSRSVTGIARTTGASLSPVVAGQLIALPGLAGAPFLIAGGLKILYDLLLYRSFRKAEVADRA